MSDPAVIETLDRLEYLRGKLPDAMEMANAQYWADAPPDGWGSYGIWDHLADVAIDLLQDGDGSVESNRGSSADRFVSELREYAERLESELSRVRGILAANDRWQRCNNPQRERKRKS